MITLTNRKSGELERRDMKLYTVKTELAFTQTHCACGRPLHTDATGAVMVGTADFHHTIFREGRAVTMKQKLALLDSRNGRLVHHVCHMHEGHVFNLNCTVLIVRQFGLPAILAYIEGMDLRDKTMPSSVHQVLALWDRVSNEPCPACEEHKLHKDDGYTFYGRLEWEGRAPENWIGIHCWACGWKGMVAA